MNEEQKNIETCLAENILSEVANVPTDPQFRSLVDEALDPLKQQAAAQTGYDGYKEVVMYHQPYTFTSQVKQMKSNLILLLRRLWRFPFGRGTTASSAAGSSASDAGSSAAGSAAAPIRSLADMWQHYITRLKGNPEYGIPSRLSQLTDLPSAPALLADRKIGGVPEAADGESILQVLNRRAEITEIQDDNSYTMTINPLTYFANVEKLQMLCSAMVYTGDLNAVYMRSSHLKELDCPNLETITDNGSYPAYNSQFGSSVLEHVSLPKLKSTTGCLFQGGVLPTEVELPALETATRGVLQGVSGIKRMLCPKLKTCNGYSYNPNLLSDCPDLEYIYVPNLTILNYYKTTGAGGTLQNMPKLEELHIGKVAFTSNDWNTVFLTGCGALIKLVIYGDLTQSIYLNSWSPTLDSSNIQQFLQNFKTYIANRLTDKGAGLTLTLSQEVRNAIHAAEDEYGIENIIITKKGWTISPAPN